VALLDLVVFKRFIDDNLPESRAVPNVHVFYLSNF